MVFSFQKAIGGRQMRFGGIAALCGIAWAMNAASASAATFKVRLTEGSVPPGMPDPLGAIDQLELTYGGSVYFGADTTGATTSDEFVMSAMLKPFTPVLLAREGNPVTGLPGVTHGTTDAVVDINEAGDFVFLSASLPGPLDVVSKNGASFVRAGELLAGETVNTLHQPQIDGTGTPWFLADIGANAATDIALFHGTNLVFREGGSIDGVPVSSISISESTSGANLRVNEHGDYILVVDDGDAQGQDVHVILNGVNVLESTDLIPDHGEVYWFNQVGLTRTGNHWFVQLSYRSLTSPQFAGDEAMFLDGTTLLVEQGQDLGDGLSVGTIQTGDVNSDGNWIARVDLVGVTGQDAVLANGQIVARTGQPIGDSGYNWGTSIGFVNDIRLNDCGEIALVSDITQPPSTTAIEALITGSIYNDGDVDGDFDIDGADITTFIDIAVGANTNGCAGRRADLNEDGVVNGLDVGPLVAAIVP